MSCTKALFVLTVASAFTASLTDVEAQPMASGPASPPSIADRFGRLDTNKDGFIAWSEAAPQRRAEFATMDANGDAQVSPDEFRDRAAPFTGVDANLNGTLSEDEYLGHHQSMFQRFDVDGDKQINMKEFTAAQEAARGK